MNRKISLALAVACTLVGCNEKIPHSDVEEGQLTTIEFSVPVSRTKSLSAFAEDAVNSLQVFVFGPDKKIDAYGMAQNRTLSLTCTTGEKEIYALVNAAQRADVKTVDDLLKLKTNLNENTAEGLVMEGYIRKVLAGTTPVTVPVYRNAAVVTLKAVKSAFELDIHKKQEFKITGVSLINVAGDKVYTGNIADGDIIRPYDVAPELWYNKMSTSDSPLSILSDEVVDGVIASGASYSKAHSFYCYPNPVKTDASNGVWSPRFTRLVVAATLGGQQYFYPVSIPEIKSNTRYDVSLTVTRPGSDSPDSPVQKLQATVDIDVRPWAQAPAINETI